MTAHQLLAQRLQPLLRQVASTQFKTAVFTDTTTQTDSCAMRLETHSGEVWFQLVREHDTYHLGVLDSTLPVGSFAQCGPDLDALLNQLLTVVFA